jgi:hypothetical protein
MTGANPIHVAVAAAKRDFGWFEDHLPGRHAAPETPAPQPVNLTAAAAAAEPQEEPVSIAKLEADIKNDITEGAAWVAEWAARIKTAAPSIIETTEAAGGPTVARLIQVAAGRVLPPGVEDIAASLLGKLFDDFAPAAQPAPAQAADGQPQQPAVPAGQ